MAKLPGAFNANDHDKMGDFSPIPAGEYLAHITGSDLIDNKAKTGKFLKLDFKILSGPHKDRNVWARLNIVHPNSQTVEIAQKELATICAAVGLVRITDSSELHGKPMMIKVTVKPGDGQFLDSNEIKNYSMAKDVARPKLVAGDEPAAAEEAKSERKKAPWADD